MDISAKLAIKALVKSGTSVGQDLAHNLQSSYSQKYIGLGSGFCVGFSRWPTLSNHVIIEVALYTGA